MNEILAWLAVALVLSIVAGAAILWWRSRGPPRKPQPPQTP